MTRFFVLLLIAVSLQANALLAGEAINPKALTALKRATAYIRVESKGLSGSGSGFLVHVNKDEGLIVTNLHVVDPTVEADLLQRQTASDKGKPQTTPSARINPHVVMRNLKDVAVTAILDSGTRDERALKAEVVAIDADHDLAVLRITAKDLPQPIDFGKSPELSETMTVYTFGFPFGKSLATGKGGPAITVNKGGISSLRANADGELALVQIDTGLNPGNSGGPMVDARGQLIGVSVATIRNSSGIGLAIPAAEVRKMFQGRLGAYFLTLGAAANGKVPVTLDVHLIDPLDKVKAVKLYYLPGSAAKPIDSLDKASNAGKIELAFDKRLATAKLALDESAKHNVLMLQAVFLDAAGKSVLSKIIHLSLADDLAPLPNEPPVAGSTEYTPKNNRFTIMMPPGQKSGQRTKIFSMGTFKVPSESAYSETREGINYVAASLGIPAVVMRDIPANRRFDTFRDMLVSGVRGKVMSEKDIQQGTFKGKEYLVDRIDSVARLQMYMQGGFVFWAVIDSRQKDDLRSKTAAGFFGSFKMRDALLAKKEPALPKKEIDPKKEATPTVGNPASGVATRILGGAFDPEFKDGAPDGALLIGLELSLAKNGNAIKGMRAIYRSANGEETKGTQFGKLIGPVATLKAKDGYAIGGLRVNAGLWVDGLSVTFLRVKGAQLDAGDSYQSEHVGGKGGNPTILAGDGTPVVGIAGKSNKQGTNGIGLLLKKKS